MMRKISNIGLFCGSNVGVDNEYTIKADELGVYLAKNHIGLIFGGGKIGLMGVVSQAMMRLGGSVIGIIPEFLRSAEKAYSEDIEMQVVANMAIRKDKMIASSDAFIVLPGGIGTYEEVFEVLSRLQLHQIDKPIGFLNINGFFDSFVALMQTMAAGGFIPYENLELFCISENVTDLIVQLQNFSMPNFNKMINTGLKNSHT